MVFEIVFTVDTGKNGFSAYVKNLAPQSGLQLIEHCSRSTVIEGEWEAAMGFVRQCQEYVLQHEGGPRTMTTVHIHS